MHGPILGGKFDKLEGPDADSTAIQRAEGTPADLVAARSTLTGQHLADYVAA